MDSQGRRVAGNIVVQQGPQSEPATKATIYLSPAETPGQRSTVYAAKKLTGGTAYVYTSKYFSVSTIVKI